VVTRLRVEGSRNRGSIPDGAGMLHRWKNLLDRLYDPAIYLANGYREKTHFPRAKRPGFQNHQSLPSSGKAENERIYVSTAPIRRFEVNGGKFTFLHLPIMSFRLEEFVVGIIVESTEKYPVSLTILIQV